MALYSAIWGLSSVTNNDWIEIRSTLQATENRDFFCDVCLSNRATEQKLESKACKVERGAPLWVLDDVKYFRCIGNFVSDSVLNWLGAYNQFGKGTMPFPGSYTEQPAKVIELFGLFDSYFQKSAKEAERKEQSKRAMLAARGGGTVGR